MNTLGPARILRTGDDSPATSLTRYVWRMSGWRQLGLCALALAVTALNLAPIELQRRLIDDAVATGDLAMLWRLAAIYMAVILAHQALKFLLKVLQGWLGESATAYTRRHLLGLYRDGRAGRDAAPGEAATILGAEVDKLGGFVGAGPSGAFTDATLLLGVAGYMLWVEPAAGALALALVAPQVLLTPLMQRRLNRLTRDQLALGRSFGGAVARSAPDGADAAAPLIGRIFRNRMAIHVWKQAMKAALNLLGAAAPLALIVVGGWLVMQGETTVGVIVAFLSALARVAEPIRNLIAFYRTCAQATVQHAMIARWM